MSRPFWGPDAKAWFSNGLDELRQLFTLGVQQIQPGPLPTYLTPTHGELTAEKLGQKDASPRGPEQDHGPER